MASSADKRSAGISATVVTTSRADYGLLRWVIHDLAHDPEFHLNLVVTGSHLSSKHGNTVDEIIASGHKIEYRIPVDLQSNEPTQLARATADIVVGLTSQLVARRPDVVLTLGDRWELLAVASACTLTGTPIAHFSGGEVSEGALDECVRHSLTKLSHLHLVANDVYASRVLQMGEEDWRVSVCGGPGIDNFTRLTLLSAGELSAKIGIDLSRPTAIVTFHPPTRSIGDVDYQVLALVEALRTAAERFGLQYVVTGPNADPGADRIESHLRAFVASMPGSVYVPSLGSQLYLSLLNAVRLMIGNSSSAFHEAPVAGVVCVNVGDRQQGRLSGGNVIHVKESAQDIISGIELALKVDRETKFECPYGTGSSSRIALSFLKETFARYGRTKILHKKFVDRYSKREAE